MKMKAEILRLHNNDSSLSFNEIAQQVGCDRSTVGKVIKNKDGIEQRVLSGANLDGMRQRTCQWPLVEKAVLYWVQGAQASNLIVTDAILVDKAKHFCTLLYGATAVFSASNGWLSGFKKRHQIHAYTLHGEAASAPPDEVIQEHRRLLQDVVARFDPEDRYNADESALFWRALPTRTQATGRRAGTKINKERITVMLASNSTGSHKLHPWVIGYSQNPRYHV